MLEQDFSFQIYCKSIAIYIHLFYFRELYALVPNHIFANKVV